MVDFFLFKSFLAHRLAKFIYYLVLVAKFLGYLGLTGFAFLQDTTAGLIVLGVGFLALILASIIFRVVMEVMVVIFEIHSELQELNKKFEAGAPAQTAAPAATQPTAQPGSQPGHVMHHR